MLQIHMLPAGEGDALWIEYGDPERPRRMLIDGGAYDTYEPLVKRIEAIKGRRRFELIIATHVDNDHIDALVRLFGREDLRLTVGDVWFNAWDQIRDDRLGVKQGEMLTDRLREREYRHNRKAKGKAIYVDEPGRRRLPVHNLLGGMRLTVIGPRRDDLDMLRRHWKEIIDDAGLKPGGEFTGAKLIERTPKHHKDRLGAKPPNLARWAARDFTEDPSKRNRSSISVLAEIGDRAVLFTGDARSDGLIEGIDRLLTERGLDRLRLDALKVPHHGSKHNVSIDLMARLECSHFLISTDGSRHDHPNDDAIARLIHYSERPTLHFNYRSEDNKHWDNKEWKKPRKLNYITKFPPDTESGLLVEFEVGDAPQ